MSEIPGYQPEPEEPDFDPEMVERLKEYLNDREMWNEI
jgi:hypothetical protein